MPICFNVFNPKSLFWKKLNQKARLVRYKTQLFGKSCVLGFWRERAKWKRSFEVHFGKSPYALSYIHWTILGNYQIALALKLTHTILSWPIRTDLLCLLLLSSSSSSQIAHCVSKGKSCYLQSSILELDLISLL